MDLEQRQRLEKVIRISKYAGPMASGTFAGFFFGSLHQSVLTYQNSSLSSDLLTVYGVLFGALIVVVALISPRGDSAKKPGDRKEFNSVLDKLFLLVGMTLCLIIANVGSYFPEVGPFIYLFVSVQLIGFPWLFISMTSMLMRIRLYFLV